LHVKQIINRQPADLAIAVSCIGRKLVMVDRADEEIEAVSKAFGNVGVLTGLYSQG